MSGSLIGLAATLWVCKDVVNVGVLKQGDQALLFDFGSGVVLSQLEDLGISSVDRIFLTHHHRDQAYGLLRCKDRGFRVTVPKEERHLFDGAEGYWSDPASRWHLYNVRPHHFTLTESIDVSESVTDGATFSWGDATITAVATPGHTDGSLSYVVDLERKRFVFCGDVIYEGGRALDLHSLQKGGLRP